MALTTLTDVDETFEVTLLALAGARLWLRVGHALELPRCERLDRLALLAPVTDFFQAPASSR